MCKFPINFTHTTIDFSDLTINDITDLAINDITDPSINDITSDDIGLCASIIETAWARWFASNLLFFLLCSSFYMIYTDSYWANKIDKVGFNKGAGLLNIGRGIGDDDGVGVIAMDNDKIIGCGEDEWIKCDDEFNLSSDKCNKLIICGGRNEDDNTSDKVSKIINKYKSSNEEYKKLLQTKSNEALRSGFISKHDANDINMIWHNYSGYDPKSENARYEEIKRYIIVKYTVLTYSSKDVFESTVDKEMVEFYKEAMKYISEGNLESILVKAVAIKNRV